MEMTAYPRTPLVALALGTSNGQAVDAARPSPPVPNSHAQATARRYMLWLLATEHGLPDPVTRRTRHYSTAELALLWGTSANSIRVGITRARRIRQKCLQSLA
jgi:hypothetical protein